MSRAAGGEKRARLSGHGSGLMLPQDSTASTVGNCRGSKTAHRSIPGLQTRKGLPPEDGESSWGGWGLGWKREDLRESGG